MASSRVLPSQNKIQYHLFVYFYHHITMWIWAGGGRFGDTSPILLHMTLVVIIGLQMALYLQKLNFIYLFFFLVPVFPRELYY